MQSTLTVMPWSERNAVRGFDIRFEPPNASPIFNDDLNRMGFMATLGLDGQISGRYKQRKGHWPSQSLAQLLDWVWAHSPETIVSIRPVVRGR